MPSVKKKQKRKDENTCWNVVLTLNYSVIRELGDAVVSLTDVHLFHVWPIDHIFVTFYDQCPPDVSGEFFITIYMHSTVGLTYFKISAFLC